MKKQLLLMLALVISVAAFGQYKAMQSMQVEAYKNASHTKSAMALAPDFTTVDIDGNSHTLYDYLNAGKPVILEISATWCSPCWSFHQNGALKDFYNAYGPNGTDEAMVLFVEGDPSTAEAELYAASANSQGDWVTGTPFPIINDDNIASLYNLAYFPTIYMICPTGDYYEVGQGITNYFTAQEYYDFAMACPTVNDAPISMFSGPGSTVIGASVTFTDESFGLPTSWAWTFEDGTPATSTDQNPSVSWATAGTFEVTLIASNANGAGDVYTMEIDVIDPSSTNDMMVTFEECFNNWTGDFAPYNWITVDGDEGNVWGDYGDVGVTGQMAFNVYDHAEAEAAGLTTLAPHGGGKAAMVMNAVTADAPNDDWFISPQFQLGTESSLSVWAASLSVQWGAEEFYVAVSTTDNAPASFTYVSNKLEPGEAYEEFNVDLSAYDGQAVYVALHCVSNDHWVMLVDDITITTTSVGINNEVLNQVRVYPNPTTGLVQVENAQNASINVYNVIGELVMSVRKASQLNTLDLSGLHNGTYMIQVVSDNAVKTQKVVLNR